MRRLLSLAHVASRVSLPRLAERAGIVSLSLEGFMLGGAFGAVIGAHYTESAWIGVVAAWSPACSSPGSRRFARCGSRPTRS